jgi:TRAP-type C4-dicarboxylate transport system permease small subunit
VIIDWICLGLMVALVVDVFLGVFSRYVLHATFQWYDEVARLCFVWMVFLGAAVAVRRGGVAMYPVARRQVSDSLELSMLWFHGALPVGGALMILFSLPHLWRLVRAR